MSIGIRAELVGLRLVDGDAMNSANCSIVVGDNESEIQKLLRDAPNQ